MYKVKFAIVAIPLVFLQCAQVNAQSFQKCLELGISRQACEDAMAATAPSGSQAYKDAMHSYMERELHKDDPTWQHDDSE